MSKFEILIMGIVALFLLSLFVSANPDPSGAVVLNISTTTGSSAAGAHAAGGGNITELKLVAESQTLRWQGYFGNISGNITLDDSNGNTMYKWSSPANISGEVYACRSSTVTWSLLGTHEVSPENLDSALSWAVTEIDSANNTFTNASNTAFSAAGNSISANDRPAVLTLNSTGGGEWETVLLVDSEAKNIGDFVYVGRIENSTDNYNGGYSDFQMIVPEDNTDNVAGTNHFFFVELG